MLRVALTWWLSWSGFWLGPTSAGRALDAWLLQLVLLLLPCECHSDRAAKARRSVCIVHNLMSCGAAQPNVCFHFNLIPTQILPSHIYLPSVALVSITDLHGVAAILALASAAAAAEAVVLVVSTLRLVSSS